MGREEAAVEAFKTACSKHAKDLDDDMVEYGCEVVNSTVTEHEEEQELRDELHDSLGGIFEGAMDEKALNAVCNAIVKAACKAADGGKSNGQGAAKGQAPDHSLIAKCERLLLMYGGGHLLLKDTTLELRKGMCYGVVGANGAGKTTLMGLIAGGAIEDIPKSVRCTHVRSEQLNDHGSKSAVGYMQFMTDGLSEQEAQHALKKVGFEKEMQEKVVEELSGGWRMRLILACTMLNPVEVLLLDEPTNHLDVHAVAWLAEWVRGVIAQAESCVLLVSHDPDFLNEVCTHIIHFDDTKLNYYEGDFSAFQEARNVHSEEEIKALLAVRGVEPDNVDSVMRGSDTRILFPNPGKLPGITSLATPVLEAKKIRFRYTDEGPLVLDNVTCKLTLNSRVAMVGRNGAGKTTLMSILCGELIPSEVDGICGEVSKHRNLRLAYIAQHTTWHLEKYLKITPYVYMQIRFKNGWDEELQKRLTEPANEEEAAMRKEMGRKYGKHGCEVRNLVGRHVKGKEIFYEVEWDGLRDMKQNTTESMSKLRQMGVLGMVKALDERIAVQTVGVDQRPITRREIVKHFEQFGLTEDLVCNRTIGSFSQGQKSKLTLGAAMWTKPHMVALDEPTNYIDMETLDALAKALKHFRGGVLVVTHSQRFVDEVCNEIWKVEDKKLTIAKNIKED
eukprot:CAMPEP_0204489590 /NCGR_PEP_ID=MMETSP0471-20130131/72627_1 /ASSEMBLY_ACC=CAM_ASM_000602 /TAXON_ID=2969 /ORGANISM="Oxyrrhis marina" /LENGTH=672 /DNA_ID=CAMNT_0051493459 /DNA_START=10 /DNA_END=2028 /DNA_ORIENTATION=-